MSTNEAAPISELEGIKPDEAEKLRNVGITTIRDLWVRIGKDPENGLDKLAKQVDMEPHRLMDLLAARVVIEARKGESTWLRQPKSRLSELRLFLGRHTLDIVLVLGIVVLVLLMLHALRLLG